MLAGPLTGSSLLTPSRTRRRNSPDGQKMRARHTTIPQPSEEPNATAITGNWVTPRRPARDLLGTSKGCRLRKTRSAHRRTDLIVTGAKREKDIAARDATLRIKTVCVFGSLRKGS